jgi:hypothetical protein
MKTTSASKTGAFIRRDVSPLVPPFNIHPAIKHLGWIVAERANAISCTLGELNGFHRMQSVLSGKEYQEEAAIEREAWPDALGSLSKLYGKPFTREIAMQVMGEAMAAAIIATTEINGHSYLGESLETAS